ncbi:MAG: fasciclin domain-containing protein [Gemmatimonadetes bacterium]|nr:fasciclin domain-containing protein [Gemmatimonadota bacterium]
MLIRRTPLIAAALALVVLSPALAQDQPQPREQAPDILTVLEQQGNHSKLLEAIRTSGLDKTLQGSGTYTLFAPTDAAFEKLPEAKRTALMADAEALKEVLSFHVIAKAIRAEDVTEPMNVETLAGTSARILREGQVLKLQAPAAAAEVRGEERAAPAARTATVVKSDIMASNGVIHVVDTVLLIEN